MLTTTILSVVPLPSETTEEMLWDDIKARLERIENHAENILDEWFHIGRDLEEIRGKNDSDRDYSRAAKRRGIVLHRNKMGAARWWFLAEQKLRDDLHIEFPDIVNPETLQIYCRKDPQKYPGKANINKARGAETFGTKEKTKNSTKQLPLDPNTRPATAPPVPAEPAIKPPPPISAKRLREIQEEEHRAEMRAKREAREAAAAAKAAQDNRPRLPVPATSVVMYGVQMWPIDDGERWRIGYYDWDQLLFATSQFMAWQNLIGPPKDDDHRSRGIQMRMRTRHLRQFIERRLEGQSKIEMLRFVEVIEKLASLYRDNPTGECRPPFDPILLTSV